MKIKIIAFFIILLVSSSVLVPIQDTNAKGNETVIIPKKAVRLRILANSDSSPDQQLKRDVRDAVNHQINSWVKDLTSFKEGQKVIQSHLSDIQKTVQEVLTKEKSNQSFTITYSKHVKFPTKLYGSFFYPAGEYEAVLIKLGAGQGANWWCVLFPPLCFLDFSNGDATTSVLKKEQKTDENQSTNIEKPPVESGVTVPRVETSKVNKGTEQTEEHQQDVQDGDHQKVTSEETTETTTKPEEQVKVKSFFWMMIKKLF
ncbi:stage II sporulation protein R [Bacillus sp. RG28]|uniref:Stage II sporulation protein R n=1 Tax=Gottfriedia endophytica TaxID=2820819 RepID=A0A940SGG6_9BACI|nr:stage II sporulation protein R [Gottfriedia endophytica]MBP0725042.1 stage II sporulation protein R [Gottfriedia endophytica]